MEERGKTFHRFDTYRKGGLNSACKLWRYQIKAASVAIQRIQKVLTELNVQIANVISDISGVTGRAILDAILAGERNRLAGKPLLCSSALSSGLLAVGSGIPVSFRHRFL
jgi:hypothetical protein